MGVVLPVYNEQDGIEHSVEVVAEAVRAYPASARVIAVDDGSKDESWAILERVAERVDMLDIVRHEANAGYGAALRTGAARAQELGLEYVTFMDSDLTNPPSDVMKIGALAAEGHAYIKASRFAAGGRMDGVPAKRAVFSHAGNFVAARLFGAGISDPTNGFRAMRSELPARWPSRERGFASIVEELEYALRDGIQPVEFPTVLTSRTDDQRATSFGYTPQVVLTYLRYPVRSCRRRARKRFTNR